MFKIMLSLFAVGLMLSFTMQASAGGDDDHHHEHHDHDEHDDEERITHYAFEAPKSRQAALELFSSSQAEIAKVLESERLDSTQLEAIHEQSYGLEAAVDALRGLKLYPEEVIDNTDEAVQALHYASENHEESVTREWFAKLQAASQTVK